MVEISSSVLSSLKGLKCCRSCHQYSWSKRGEVFLNQWHLRPIGAVLYQSEFTVALKTAIHIWQQITAGGFLVLLVKLNCWRQSWAGVEWRRWVTFTTDHWEHTPTQTEHAYSSHPGHFLWDSSWPTPAHGCVCMWRRNSRFGECLVQQSQWGPTMRNFRNLERACVFLFIRKKTHDCGRYSSHWYVGGCVSKSQKRLGVIWSRCFLSQTVLKVLRIDPLEVRATPPCKPVSHNYQHYIFSPGQS